MPELVDFQDYELVGLPRSENNISWCWEHFICQGCGECCRLQAEGVKLNHTDARRLARHDKTTLKDFTRTMKKSGDNYIMPTPCRYFKDNHCAIHAWKPDICRDFPLRFRIGSQEARWLIIFACPGGKKLLELLLTGRQPGVEYASY